MVAYTAVWYCLKARVAPVKAITVPRLELKAAVLSIRASKFLQKELRYEMEIEEMVWTDSEVVLGYISNDARRFHVFVANRVQQIRDHCRPTTEQWRHVKTTENPADCASRGVSVEDLLQHSSWLDGPSFLWEEDTRKVNETVSSGLSDADPEVKKCQTFASTVKHIHFDIHRLERFSKWQQAKVAIAKCIHYKRVLKSRLSNDTGTRPNAETNVEKLGEAEREIFKAVQINSFTEEVELLTRSTDIVNELKLKKTSVLYKLDPYVDDYGLLRVGGRIDKCNLHHDVKHPVILPKVGHLTTLIVRHFHEKTSHQGRGRGKAFNMDRV